MIILSVYLKERRDVFLPVAFGRNATGIHFGCYWHPGEMLLASGANGYGISSPLMPNACITG